MPMCYKDAIEWLARNDDCEWAIDPDEKAQSLVADIYGKPDEHVTRDLRKELKRLETAGSQSWREAAAIRKLATR